MERTERDENTRIPDDEMHCDGKADFEWVTADKRDKSDGMETRIKVEEIDADLARLRKKLHHTDGLASSVGIQNPGNMAWGEMPPCLPLLPPGEDTLIPSLVPQVGLHGLNPSQVIPG